MRKLALICAFLSFPAIAAPHKTEADWPEKDVINYLGKPTRISRQKQSGCNEVFYIYDHGGPYTQVEFRCDHANVAWITFIKDPKYARQNEAAEAQAKEAIMRLTRSKAYEMLLVQNGKLIDHVVNDQFIVNGSCIDGRCLLMYYDKP